MGQAVPTQHAAGAPVAIPSNHNLLRALLAFAAIAIVGLTVAVVILANDGDEVTGTSSAVPSEAIRYGGFNPATGRPDAAPMPREQGGYEQQLRRYGFTPRQAELEALPGTRYDGGPEAGAPGIVRFAPALTSPLVSRYDGGPEEGTRGPGR
jgi:hypothetical protein